MYIIFFGKSDRTFSAYNEILSQVLMAIFIVLMAIYRKDWMQR
jgi:hypothetical protein